MKLKKITVPIFNYENSFGINVFYDVEILFDPEVENITKDNFDQYKHDYYLEDDQIDLMVRGSVQRFLNTHSSSILKGEYNFSPDELNTILSFLGVNQSEFAALIGMSRSAITRYFKGDDIQTSIQYLIIDRLKDELTSPGLAKLVVKKIRDRNSEGPIKILNLATDQVAEFLARYFERQQDKITNLKMQKLLYYAQGIGLGGFRIKLFEEDFYAWEHGPVLKSVYHKYKVLGSGPISMDPDVDLLEIEENPSALEILNETINMYGGLSAYALRNKTHNESPWLDTNRNEIISESSMVEFFSSSIV